MRGGTRAVKRPASPVKSPGKRSPRKMMRTSPTRKAHATANNSSPIKQHVFADTPPVLKFPQQQQPASAPATRPMSSHSNTSTTLREVDVNVVANAGVVVSNLIVEKEEEQDGLDSKTAVDVPPLLKRQLTHPIPTSQVFGGESKLPMKRRTVAGLPASEGRENLPEVVTRRRLRPRSGD
jgi:hypothetical protein